MFDLTEHQLTTISTWAEVAILLFMVWERYGPTLWVTDMTPTEVDHRTGLWWVLWRNRTLVVALLGLIFVGWLHLGRTASDVPSPPTQSFPSGSSRLDYWAWEKSYDKRSFVNAHLINKGKVTALHVRRLGQLFVLPPGENLGESEITSLLKVFRTEVGLGDSNEMEIPAAENSIWFSLYGPQMSASEIKEMDAGKRQPTALVVLRYTDSTLPAGKFIYTESCVIVLKNNVVSFCPGNHNRSYVAD